MSFCDFACIFLIIISLLYLSLELHYFLRMVLSVILARFCKKPVHILDETSINGMCLTTDIDTLLWHMNNARFIRELDFAKIDFYERTGLLKCILSKGGSFAVGATTIRYRRYIRLFNRYTITSRITYWDEQNIFTEHRFINPSDKFVNAIVLTRTRLMNCNGEEVMNELLKLQQQQQDVEGETKLKPEMPAEVAKWCEYNAISSANLRSDC